MSQTVIDLITPPPSPRNETAQPAGGKAKAVAKREPEPIDSDAEDSESGCEEVVAPPARNWNKGASGNGGSSSNDAAPDDDVTFVGRSGQFALCDFPHARENCAVHPFGTSPRTFCAQCFCYVCDQPASKCASWFEHCHATHTSTEWRARRRSAQERPQVSPSPVPLAFGSPPPPAAGRSGPWTCERVLKAVEQVYPVEEPEPPGLLSSVRLKPCAPMSARRSIPLARRPSAVLGLTLIPILLSHVYCLR